ncbi:MAG: gamma-glutamyltransferase family protein [Pseudomonadales bacterium]|nr:gamma-glutamyltransferase family protein [Pseudomonadales bacterium]
MQRVLLVTRLLLGVLPLLVAACALQDKPAGAAAQHGSLGSHEQARLAPEPETGSSHGLPGEKVAIGQTAMAVTANPYATRAARAVLRGGGSAIDAAIAAQMVLGLVEPQSSGIGGGGFLMYWDAAQQKLYSYDGRETAPLAATESLFVDPEGGGRMDFGKALIGGRSVGVPGLLRMLNMAHNAHGAQRWQDLFAPAIELADEGFKVSPRLALLVAKVPALKARAPMRDYLHPGGRALAAGDTLLNPDYAQTLKTIASEGADAMYAGPIADNFVATVNRDPNPGALSVYDMLVYRAVQREPLCRKVFDYRVCGMGLPSSGASTVLSILGMLESLQLQASHEPSQLAVADDPSIAHRFIEASRLAFADRNYYLGDSDFVDVPLAGLLDAGYLQRRAQLVEPARRLPAVSHGKPVGGAARAMAEPLELASTTHLVIVDAAGNIASMTTSIESAFGSRLMADGYILNNQLTDFSFLANDAQGDLLANRVQGGKRPLSSMSPLIVFNSSAEPVLALGSPGGKSIIGFVARVLYETLSESRELAQAIAAPHIIDNGKALYVEPGIDQQVLQALRELGHSPNARPQTSGISAVQRSASGWLGVADPRREGTAAGY